MIKTMFFCLSLMLMFFQQGSAQKAPSPKAEKAFQEGRQLKREHKPARAIKSFEKALLISPTYFEAQAALAQLLVEIDHPEAEQALLRLGELDPDREPTLWTALARICIEQKRFEEALGHYESFLRYAKPNHPQRSDAQDQIANLRFQIQALQSPVPFDPIPLGEAINNPLTSQYSPIFHGNGTLMIFTRRVGGQEDFYYSIRDKDQYTPAMSIPSLNTPENEGMHTLSRDGRTMIFTRCPASSRGGCDLYTTQSVDGINWSAPEPLGPAFNTSHWDAQPTLSADGNTLIFSSTRPDGQGDSDLWWSRRSGDGNWGKVTPLPGKVNTAGKEQTPFLHADGVSLYFSSTGHPGMGDFDLFMSRYDPDSGFLTPVNLGYPINTEGHEGALSLHMDGATAYFATDRFRFESGNPGIDIYQFTLPEAVRGIPVSFVEGRVVDAENFKGISATIRIQSDEDKDSFQTVTAGPDGYFLVSLPTGRDYAFQVDHENYIFYSDRFMLGEKWNDQNYHLDIRLDRLKTASLTKETRVVLNNILFATGEHTLLPVSWFELNKVRDLLTQNPQMRIQLEGHTDAIGQAGDNQILSQKRAEAVRDWLISQGISPERLAAKGFGATRPKAGNETEEGRRENRRTEMVILQG
jgi:outer membrane protein OmpA-like peptidoglycan-associated protein